jgi:hypothetical protein
MQVEQEKAAFDFETFKNQAIADMKAGKSLVGKDGVFTPLVNGSAILHQLTVVQEHKMAEQKCTTC